LGKFVKLLGNCADVFEAIALAFKIANGFFPVKDVYPALPAFFCSVPGPLILPADLAPAP